MSHGILVLDIVESPTAAECGCTGKRLVAEHPHRQLSCRRCTVLHENFVAVLRGIRERGGPLRGLLAHDMHPHARALRRAASPRRGSADTGHGGVAVNRVRPTTPARVSCRRRRHAMRPRIVPCSAILSNAEAAAVHAGAGVGQSSRFENLLDLTVLAEGAVNEVVNEIGPHRPALQSPVPAHRCPPAPGSRASSSASRTARRPTRGISPVPKPGLAFGNRNRFSRPVHAFLISSCGITAAKFR